MWTRTGRFLTQQEHRERIARRERAARLFVRGGVLVAAALGLGALGGWGKRVRAADRVSFDPRGIAREFGSLNSEAEAARGDAALARVQLERANAVIGYSTRYQIPADLAAAIYDVALSEGIDPGLGFRLVKVESDFKQDARSSADALGYTQLQLATARFYDPTLTEKGLLDRAVNLRLGFRFLKELMGEYDNDVHLALLAYNRGPARVNEILAAGGNPQNGYSAAVLKGYKPPHTTAGEGNALLR
ncbi:MAG TPA: transglycosylase SLT domain-containing protein [Gemmatimonadales bacterium]|nr:transglycosylase SLT domain-containing protein [Gemmatimonadales bacterium]